MFFNGVASLMWPPVARRVSLVEMTLYAKIARAKRVLLKFPKVEIFFLHSPAAIACAMDPAAGGKLHFGAAIIGRANGCDDVFVGAEAAFDADMLVIIVPFIFSGFGSAGNDQQGRECHAKGKTKSDGLL